ncbi:MAG: HAMP domain-containing histidine kinase, partial [Candidatus Obscuribacterales bacterium]|nr:HAMP domain-containing histidine kinase [Candidatus Obscuribacterales bacterium]
SLALALQLGLSVLLCVVLYKTDQALQEVSLANREDTLVSNMFSRIYVCLSELILYGYHKDEHHFQTFEQISKSSESRLNAQLQSLAGKLPRKRFDRIVELNANADLLLEELGRSASFYRHERTAFGQAYFRYKLSHLLLPHLADLREAGRAIREDSSDSITENKAVQLKVLLKQILVVGLLGNIPLTLFLLYAFSRSITTPLKIVERNFSLLAEEKPILPPLDGCDELVQLDRTFHSMAASATEALARDRAIFQNMQLGLVRCSSSWMVEDVNPWLSRSLNFTKEQLIGCQIQALIPEFDDKSAMQRKVTRYLCNTAESGLVPMNISVSQFENERGKSFLVSLGDARNSAEVERLKHDFMILISRSLQQPLTKISSCIGDLKECQYGNLSEQGLRSADLAHSSVTRLLSLTKDLLSVATADSALNLDIGAHFVLDILNRAIADIGTAASVKNLKLHVTCTLDESTTVLVDERRLIQVLVNLLSNAIKFTDNGKRIELIAGRDDRQLVLEVQDQGRGIPPEQLDRVFERFVQVSSEDAKNGAGLGLAITRMLVNAHGGSISVSSEINVGTRFTIRLPITQ